MKTFNKRKKTKHSVFNKAVYYGDFTYCPYCNGIMKLSYQYLESYPYPSQWGYKCNNCKSVLDYFEAKEPRYTLYKYIDGKLEYDKIGTNKYIKYLEDK